jgi:DNA (cytosine-5)-methyltransferase 1
MEDFGPLFRPNSPERAPRSQPRGSLVTAGLFAGIGGIELGFHQAGHATSLLCEIEPHANSVLRSRFPEADLHGDVRKLKSLPKVDLLAAGFPCQDLSQAGKTAGIKGKNSGLVGEVFRLLNGARRAPKWLLLENVPFMLQLDQGRAMSFLTRTLTDLGYSWAYRVMDSRAFGLPQRRQRVILLASKTEDPRSVLFCDDAGLPKEPTASEQQSVACGFYWTEGIRGLGWAVDAVPTLKGGSGIGIPSPPAIWMRHRTGEIVTPEIRDAERLQGFPADWTLQDEGADPAPISSGRKAVAARWKLVGNAVSVPLARWVGERLACPGEFDDFDKSRKMTGTGWPSAAYGIGKQVMRVEVSLWPCHSPRQHLADFLQFPTKRLSERATAGFLERTTRSQLRFVDGFVDALANHLEQMRADNSITAVGKSAPAKKGKRCVKVAKKS